MVEENILKVDSTCRCQDGILFPFSKAMLPASQNEASIHSAAIAKKVAGRILKHL